MRRVLAVVLLVLCAKTGDAQTVTLTINSGGTGTFPNPTVTDFANQFVDNATPIAFTVAVGNITGPPPHTVTATVEICAVNATLGGGKALSDLKWRPGDLSKPYASMLQGCVAPINASRVVFSQQMAKNTSATGSAILEMVLNWATDTQTNYGTPVTLQLTVVKP
jgi:hypothetical protein